jgi:hypothetical protein
MATWGPSYISAICNYKKKNALYLVYITYL